jgi:uncharacterized protein (DUF1810 family)
MSERVFSKNKDKFNLERFVTAQEAVVDSVLDELRAGHKVTHWMWFIFPQLRGLGKSMNADYFGISSLAEAQSYLNHPILGPRLVQCTRLTNEVQNRSAKQIFGDTDSIKFRSCMTLFSQADPTQALFIEAIDKYFAGHPDTKTVNMLRDTKRQ